MLIKWKTQPCSRGKEHRHESYGPALESCDVSVVVKFFKTTAKSVFCFSFKILLYNFINKSRIEIKINMEQ